MHEVASMNSGNAPETSLVWLRHDLRLEDNPLFALPLSRRPHQMLVMYVFDRRWLTPSDSLPRLGPARLRLLWQSLMNLRGMLLRRGSDLLVRVGDPVEEVLTQVAQHDVQCLEVSLAAAPEDSRALQQLSRRLPASTRLHCHPPDQIAFDSQLLDGPMPGRLPREETPRLRVAHAASRVADERAAPSSDLTLRDTASADTGFAGTASADTGASGDHDALATCAALASRVLRASGGDDAGVADLMLPPCAVLTPTPGTLQARPQREALSQHEALPTGLNDEQWRALCEAQSPLQGLPYSLPPWPDSASRGFPPLDAICGSAQAWQPATARLAELQGGEEPARAYLSTLLWGKAWAKGDAGKGDDDSIEGASYQRSHSVAGEGAGVPAGLAPQREAGKTLDDMQSMARPADAWPLAAWLALGCVSPRRILQVLDARRREAGDEAINQQLLAIVLQRECWQRMLRDKDGEARAAWYGAALREDAANDAAFARWREGRTGDARADKAMQVLVREGWLPWSEREYLAGAWLEGGGDWRLGARWFERCLLDYDAAIHWGEWRHLAGFDV
ncbi:deoxyribodipyrimidine photo-lyase [Cobetia amphilecti]|uniref:deoxyribodipyrimidine photo-lyase n=1 Tax=Cobetia amphilecti TaxID=1055104 RepID=UPI0026E45347|nr:deoxyribodipyrimidine photo-lyase [Cobetia amphilecti]MDO6815913.1 deoxyribodipyrimidine photo-lyase [Cobetia amphilecti]